jgi:hypothetical protein
MGGGMPCRLDLVLLQPPAGPEVTAEASGRRSSDRTPLRRDGRSGHCREVRLTIGTFGPNEDVPTGVEFG